MLQPMSGLFRKPLRTGAGTEALMTFLDEEIQIPYLQEDSVLYPLIHRVIGTVRSGALVQAVEKEVGSLESGC